MKYFLIIACSVISCTMLSNNYYTTYIDADDEIITTVQDTVPGINVIDVIKYPLGDGIIVVDSDTVWYWGKERGNDDGTGYSQYEQAFYTKQTMNRRLDSHISTVDNLITRLQRQKAAALNVKDKVNSSNLPNN